ncbi:unnamed protein product [Dibothriocephalus latus]|uniref:Protein kinase domain-containing protein n=1 Tax=Dibothriocephalus latus TaxID=60516 RepID=A0A3P7LR66_DIBLA|nr:unnamed protein product [Dibothriocephalus latus]
MHDNQLTHTDLKPENILFKRSDYISLAGLTTTSLTPVFLISSFFVELGWSQPCDVWSIGCIIFELYTGYTLFQTHDNREHLAMMERTLGHIPYRMTRKSRYVDPSSLRPLLATFLFPPLNFTSPLFLLTYRAKSTDAALGFSITDDWTGTFIAKRAVMFARTVVRFLRSNYFSESSGSVVCPVKSKEAISACKPLRRYCKEESQDTLDMFDLISKMLEYDPADRIPLAAAMTHPFFLRIPAHQRLPYRFRPHHNVDGLAVPQQALDGSSGNSTTSNSSSDGGGNARRKHSDVR